MSTSLLQQKQKNTQDTGLRVVIMNQESGIKVPFCKIQVPDKEKPVRQIILNPYGFYSLSSELVRYHNSSPIEIDHSISIFSGKVDYTDVVLQSTSVARYYLLKNLQFSLAEQLKIFRTVWSLKNPKRKKTDFFANIIFDSNNQTSFG